MTANIPSVLFNFLALAFFAVIAIGIALAAYAARSMKRSASSQAVAATPVPTQEAPDAGETKADASID